MAEHTEVQEAPISTLRLGEHAKLTEWKKEPSLEDLKHDVENAKPTHHAHMAKIRKWLDNLHVEGSAKPQTRKGRSSVQPKLIRKHAEWRYSSLTEPFLSSEKLFTVSPVSWEDRPAARQNELVINWQFQNKINSVGFIDEYVRTAVDEGTVVVRVGWNRETVEEEVTVPVYGYFPVMDPAEAEQLQQAMQILGDDPSAAEQMPPELVESIRYSQENQGLFKARVLEHTQVTQEKVIKNEPTVEVFDLANLYVDPSCGGDPDKALFMALTWEATYAELKQYGDRYKNLESVNWTDSTVLGTPDHETTTPAEMQFRDRSRKKVVVTEYWGMYDIEGDGRLQPIVAAWIGNTMIRCELNPFPDGKPPFVITTFMPLRKSIYGEPDGELLEDNQRILGAVTRGMIDLLARSANGQRGMSKAMLDVVNRRRFENGEDYEFNPAVHPSNGIFEHKFPEIPQSAMQMAANQNMDAESLTGVKTYDQGLDGKSLGPSATAARGVLDASSKREMGILRRLAKGISRVGLKIIAMNQEFMSEEETIRLTNDQFVQVRRDELQGNFDMTVSIATAEEDNARANDLSFMLQTMGNNMDFNMTKMILTEICRLRRMPDLARAIEKFEPQPDPLAEQMKQLEIAELEAKVQKLQAEAMESQAKAQKALADARMASSKADLTDLDYVEQETGTKHLRDIDRISQQSEANTNREITKGILSKGQGGENGPKGPSNENIAEAVGFHELTKQRPV